MLNVKTTVKGKILTIEVDLSQEHGESASGKTIVIASSKGNQTIEGTGGAVLGINVYKRK